MARDDAQRLAGARVIILQGEFQGREGICLGQANSGLFSIAPNGTDAVVTLAFERDFGLLSGLSGDPIPN